MAATADGPVVARRFTERSAETRAAILAAARARFAADGYEKATIRAIAADAGIDASMVMRYFGDKAGLFRAAAVDDLRLGELRADGPADLAEQLARALFATWEGGENPVMRLLMRTAFTHPEAVSQVQRVLDEQVKPAVLAALPDDPDAGLRAGLVFSQTLGLIATRYMLGVEPLASADADVAESAVRAAIELHLTRPLR